MKNLPETYKGFTSKELIQVVENLWRAQAENTPDDNFEAMGDMGDMGDMGEMIREFRLTALMDLAYQKARLAIEVNGEEKESRPSPNRNP